MSQVVASPIGWSVIFWPVVVVAVRRGRRPGKAVEQVVEGAILLNDDDDVLDLAARAVVMLSLRAAPAVALAQATETAIGSTGGKAAVAVAS